jgi:addiction module HigA family antidote
MAERTKNEYRPSEVSPPGATLREILEERGISQAELAARTGRPKKTINEIVKGKAAITNQTALELELALGISAEFWNRREQHYREYLARQEERSRLEKNIKWLRGFPLSSMVKHGWIRRCSDKPTQLRELLQFFGVTSPEQWSELWARQEVAFRRSPKFRARQADVATWLRQGMRTAEQTSCLPYDATRFRERLRDIRSLTRKAPAVFQPEVMRLCAEAGVAVAFVPGMPKSRVSGATSSKALAATMMRSSRRIALPRISLFRPRSSSELQTCLGTHSEGSRDSPE